MDECTICFETMKFHKDKLTQCLLCLQCVHTKCFTQWKRKACAFSDKCLYCQVENNLHRINRTFCDKLSDCCC